MQLGIEVYVFLVTAVIKSTFGSGVSSAEIALFTNSGSQGGTISYTDDGSTYTITANGLPDHNWQMVNPNAPSAQSYTLTIKKSVTVGSKQCLPMGMIGMTKHGVGIYNLLTSSYLNAVEGSDAETFDSCDGHPTDTGAYHYHKLPSSCVYSGNTDEFLGVAIDGIPIYGPKVSWQSSDVKSADLDDCNGKEVNGEYKYFVTSDWPYFMGCLKGEVVDSDFTSSMSGYTCGTTTVFDKCGYLCPCANVNNADNISCDAGNIKLSWMAISIVICVAFLYV